MSYRHRSFELIPPIAHSLFSFFPYISAIVAADIPDNVDVPPGGSRGNCEEGFRGSNDVEDRPDEQPYEMAMAVDSDDDRPVPELTDSDVEMLRRFFPGRSDPRVNEFSDLTLSDQACAEGRDDELLDAAEAGPDMVIEKGRVYNNLPALKRWL